MSLKILTVDDSKTIRLIVTRALKPFDCLVLEASNGVEGLAVASRQRPDLILLDYTMPIMDGFEVLARLRSDAELKSTPVIMLTAEAGRDTVVKIAKLGVRDYLIKPFKEELLLERLTRVIALKPKSEQTAKPKRFDDPIRLLVVDDKPAIVEQIRLGLADTPWQITSAEQPGQALDHCMKDPVDLVLASLSLPKDGAYILLQNLRACSNTVSLPVFGLCVKTETSEQTRAQQAGFASIATKPIDPDELKTKICRTLRLETAYKYFRQQGTALVLTLPKQVSQPVSFEIAGHLKGQLVAAVDAGVSRLIIDLSCVQDAEMPVIELILAAIQGCAELSLKHSIVGSESFKTECQSYEDSQNWTFFPSLEAALAPAAADEPDSVPTPASQLD